MLCKQVLLCCQKFLPFPADLGSCSFGIFKGKVIIISKHRNIYMRLCISDESKLFQMFMWGNRTKGFRLDQFST